MCAPSIISWSTTTPLGATSPTSTSHPATRRIWQTQCAAWPSRTSSLSSSSGTAASIATLPWHGVGPPHRCAALGWSLAWSAIDALPQLCTNQPIQLAQRQRDALGQLALAVVGAGLERVRVPARRPVAPVTAKIGYRRKPKRPVDIPVVALLAEALDVADAAQLGDGQVDRGQLRQIGRAHV